jgi:hypothetical protein
MLEDIFPPFLLLWPVICYSIKGKQRKTGLPDISWYNLPKREKYTK